MSAVESPGWVRVCAVDDIEAEDVRLFSTGEGAYAIYRSEDDCYFATDAYCTHERALLCDGLVMDGVIECPRHNGRFDFRTGRALGAPALVALRTHPVAVEDGFVYLRAGD